MRKVSLEKNSGWRKTDSNNSNELQLKESNNSVFLVNKRGEVFEVFPLGSLTTLALGSLGIKAWKRAKELAK